MKKTQKHSEMLDSAVQEDNEDIQFEEIKTCLNKNNSNRAYQLVRQLTSEKQDRDTTVKDKSGKCLKEERPHPHFPQ